MRRVSGLVIALTVLAALSAFHPYPYDNVVTRWALARQLVANGTLKIDPYAGLTNDRAASGGHLYCDKAVWTSIIAAAGYFPLHALGIADSPGALPVGGAGRYLVERVVAGGSLLLLLLMLRGLLKRERFPVILPVAAVGFGSILLPYATMLYGHVPAALLIFVSYASQRRKRWLAADITGALASAFEFPLLVLYGVLLAYRRRSDWTPWRAFRVPLILLCAFLPQLLHNWIAFGSPLTMGYSLETAEVFSGMGEGLFGFTLPSPRSLYLLTLSPERGLLFYMPWIALGMAGFFSGKTKLVPVLRSNPLPACIVLYLLLFSSYYMPTGGWAFGPRHLIPVVPFAAVGLARFMRGSPERAFVAWLLVLPAILQAMLGTLGEPHLPVHPAERPIPLPQVSIALKMMLDGHHATWLLGTAGVLAIVLGAMLLWFRSGYGAVRVTWWGVAALLFWAALGLLSPSSGWEGKLGYYRGVLAQHRREYRLAAGYYREALEDPTAPAEHIEGRMRYCEERDTDWREP